MKTISKLSRCVKAPMRVLCRARDLYVKGMNAYAGRMPSSLPKSFSVCSSEIRPSDESGDLRTLMRVASQRRQKEENMAKQLDEQQQQVTGTSRTSNYSRLPKSLSVGMGKIDEDKPCNFAEDSALFYPRFGSYAVANRKTRL
ncbi:hypothetical protein ACLOJK_003436 [Asimina triloba]